MMTGKETVELLQQHFPKFTKVALCMVRNPEYGVTLSPKAKRILDKAEGKMPKKRSTPNRLTIRLNDNEMAAVKEVMELTGCKSYRELIEKALEKMGG
jgi:hypothetical protein